MGLIQKLSKGISGRIKKSLSNPYKKTGLSWATIKKLKHLPAGTLRTIPFLKGTVSFYDPHEFLVCINEFFIHEIYKQPIRSDNLVIDCGANIGLSVIYLRSIFPKARIIAFEPDEKNFELLQANMRSQAIDNVELKNEAVWIDNTVLSFESQGNMSSKISESSSDTRNTVKKVKATRLKDLLLQPVDFLKIDIEGAEYELLKDIKDKLTFVKTMFLEYHGMFQQNDELISMLEWVRAAGFSFYIKEAADLNPTPFIPKSKPDTGFDVQLNIFCVRQ